MTGGPAVPKLFNDARETLVKEGRSTRNEDIIEYLNERARNATKLEEVLEIADAISYAEHRARGLATPLQTEKITREGTAGRPTLSTPGLLTLHGLVREALERDDATPASEPKKYGVREYPDWRAWSDFLEEQLTNRGVPFSRIVW